VRKLRLPVRLYATAVIAAAGPALALAPLMPTRGSLDPWLLGSLSIVATVANLRVVRVSAKTKVAVGGAAVFAAVLTAEPAAAMAIGGLSAFIGLTFATRQPLYNRLFNASVTDIAVALQTRRDPIRAGWPEHRRDVFHHAAPYLLGILAAISAERQTWSLALFLVPMALILLALREATRLRQHTKDAIVALADLIDQRDPYAYGHSLRGAEHAARVARHLRLPSERVEVITEAARMHDVGKVTTPDHVLKEPGPLDAREWDEMHRRCDAGHHFLQRIPDLLEGADLVLSHHERVDGTGYPAAPRASISRSRHRSSRSATPTTR